MIVEPTRDELCAELERIKYRKRFMGALRNTIYTLVALASIVLLAVIWLPVYRITGVSMANTLRDGEVVVAWRTEKAGRGDIIAFEYGGKTLVKRVIAVAGDTVDVKEDGTVWINGSALDEPYLTEKALGECDAVFPMIVPEDCVFVMGDNRAESVDSRSTEIGCVATGQIRGRVMIRIWPIGKVKRFF